MMGRVNLQETFGLINTVIDLSWSGGTGANCFGGSAPGATPSTSSLSCTYVINGSTVISSINLVAEFGTFGVIVDPVIVQVPSAATAFGGTYAGPGGTQNLQITEVAGPLRADLYTDIVAEPGMKLVIVDFPTTAPANTTYNFTLHFQLPGNAASVPMKAVFAGKVTVAGETFYPPLLPCETDFSNITGVDMLQSADFQPVSVPSPTGQGCAGRTYQYVPSPSDSNYQGMWWGGSAEDGWGINFAHQGKTIFGTWFTYDTTGKGWWLTLITDDSKSTSTVFQGDLFATTGPPFNTIPFVKTGPPPSPIGSATLTFNDVNNGSFHYDVNLPTGTISQTKAITRQPLGTAPFATCAAGVNLTAVTNYQDMWWAGTSASPKAEDGWGINFAHQGDVIFASWFTYNLDGSPLWLVTTLQKDAAPGVYKSTNLFRPSGPRFDAYDTHQYNPNASVGNIIVAFADGNNATFSYSVLLPGMTTPAVQNKAITRQLFSPTGTSCR